LRKARGKDQRGRIRKKEIAGKKVTVGFRHVKQRTLLDSHRGTTKKTVPIPRRQQLRREGTKTESGRGVGGDLGWTRGRSLKKHGAKYQENAFKGGRGGGKIFRVTT